MNVLPVQDYYSYDDLIESLGHEVILKVEDNDYQGDTRVLLRDGQRYGVLIFGWGSCSGCDALESAGSNHAEVTELRDGMVRDIHWEDSREAMHRYLSTKDWGLEYAWHSAETQEFVAKALEATR